MIPIGSTRNDQYMLRELEVFCRFDGMTTEAQAQAVEQGLYDVRERKEPIPNGIAYRAGRLIAATSPEPIVFRK